LATDMLASESRTWIVS